MAPLLLHRLLPWQIDMGGGHGLQLRNVGEAKMVLLHIRQCAYSLSCQIVVCYVKV